MTLLQNDATHYYKTRQLFLVQFEANLYYKTPHLFYYKMSPFYYQTQVLQNAPFLLQNAAGITKCADYYKTRHNIIINYRANLSNGKNDLLGLFCLIRIIAHFCLKCCQASQQRESNC